MNNNIFKFISEDQLDNNPLLMVINEDMVQNLADANLGRELSDVELNRFAENIYSSDLVDEFIIDTIREITDEKENDWSSTDESFLGKLSKEEKSRCLQEKLDLESKSD